MADTSLWGKTDRNFSLWSGKGRMD